MRVFGEPEYTRTEPAALNGVICLGDSNTIQSYFSAVPTGRWTSKLSSQLSRRVINHAADGAQTEDFLNRGSHMLTPELSNWRLRRAQYALLMFGLNETALGLVQFEADTRELVSRLLGQGTTPIFLTNIAVDFSGGHYSWDRNVTIDSYDDVYRDLSTELSLHLIDTNAEAKTEIGLGTWDHRIRADGVTFDDSLDASQPEPWASDGIPSSWYTDIHLNEAGSTLWADTIEAYFVANSL